MYLIMCVRVSGYGSGCYTLVIGIGAYVTVDNSAGQSSTFNGNVNNYGVLVWGTLHVTGSSGSMTIQNANIYLICEPTSPSNLSPALIWGVSIISGYTSNLNCRSNQLLG